MKAPAFMFYAADFLVGTATMTAEEVGGYIRLLCYQWTHGRVTNDLKQVARLAGVPSNRLALVLSKFDKDENGAYYNVRLESEKSKQEAYREKQRENGAKASHAKAKPSGKPHPKPSNKPEPTGQAEPQPNPALRFSSSTEAKASVPPTPLAGGVSVEVIDFDYFWKLYPKRKKKDRALKLWKTIKPSTELAARIIFGLKQHLRSEEWHREGGRFIPLPSTWLFNAQWEDEVKVNYAPGKAMATAPQPMPEEPWMASVRKLRKIQAENPEGLVGMTHITVIGILRSLPNAAWRFIEREEYNTYTKMLKDAEPKLEEKV